MKLKFLISILVLLFVVSSTTAYEIDGNKVYVDDDNAYISAYPHTIQSSGYVVFEIKSKTYTGDINVIWGFDTTTTQPKNAELYNPTYIEKTCSECIDVYPNNLTCKEYNYYDCNYWKNWWSVSDRLSSINYNFDNKNKWYYASNVPIEANQTYKVRSYIEVKPNTTGKYDFGVYPSSYGSDIQSALNNGHLYYIDPWYDSSYDYKKQITNSSSSLLLPVNNFNNVTLSTSSNWIYGIPNNGYLYYNDDSDVICANDTHELCMIQTEQHQRRSCPDKPNGLVEFWSLDTEDAWGSINDNNGTLQGTASLDTTNAVHHGGIDLDGDSDYIQISDSADLDITGDITISMWFGRNWASEAQFLTLVSKTDAYRYTLTGDGDSHKQTLCIDGTCYWGSYAMIGYTGAPQHIAVTLDSSDGDIYYYHNGSQVDSELNAESLDNTNNNDLFIGWKDGSGGYFSGVIDHVKLYDRELSGTEIQEEYLQSKYTILGAEQQYPWVPPAPTNLAHSTGNFYINYTWSAGSGNVTDSYVARLAAINE